MGAILGPWSRTVLGTLVRGGEGAAESHSLGAWDRVSSSKPVA